MDAAETTPGRPWFRRLLRLSPPPPDSARPASTADGALERYGQLSRRDTDIPEPTRTHLFEPDGPSRATVVIWHGFTNAPSQFTRIGEELKGLGYRVLVPRMPFHGEADVLNRDLVRLTPDVLIRQVNDVVDIATGFGDPVWVLGLSAGATMAGWAAATRGEVGRLVLAAPLVAPVGFPMPLVRLFVKFPRIVPRIYWWWDPRVKDRIEGSPYAYPGFPIPGIMSFLHLSEWLYDGTVRAGHELERVVLVTNPGDFAIRKDAARDFASTVFGGHAEYLGEATVDPELKWMHDFVDPLGPSGGTTDQVTALLLAALGPGDPAADGVLVPPLLTPEP